MAGIKETKELVRAGLVAAKVVKDVAADGKVSVIELIPAAIKLAQPLTAALKEANLAWTEIKDLDAAELQELLDMAKAEFGEEYAGRAVVEGALQLALTVIAIVKELKAAKP